MTNKKEIFRDTLSYPLRLLVTKNLLVSTINFGRTKEGSDYWYKLVDRLMELHGDVECETYKTAINFITEIDNTWKSLKEIDYNSEKRESNEQEVIIDWNGVTYKVFLNIEKRDISYIEIVSFNDEEDFLRAKIKQMIAIGEIEIKDKKKDDKDKIN